MRPEKKRIRPTCFQQTRKRNESGIAQKINEKEEGKEVREELLNFHVRDTSTCSPPYLVYPRFPQWGAVRWGDRAAGKYPNFPLLFPWSFHVSFFWEILSVRYIMDGQVDISFFLFYFSFLTFLFRFFARPYNLLRPVRDRVKSGFLNSSGKDRIPSQAMPFRTNGRTKSKGTRNTERGGRCCPARGRWGWYEKMKGRLMGANRRHEEKRNEKKQKRHLPLSSCLSLTNSEKE